MPAERKTVVGLALGGGAALGWAHIGVLQVLEEAGLKPGVVAGTSIGSIVGAAYALGKMDKIEEVALGVSWFEMALHADFEMFSTGLLGGDRIMATLRRYFGDVAIEDLDVPYAAVAADLANNEKVVFRSGPVVDAVRASISIPGIFRPVANGGRLLVDGGLCDPVPVSVCREMGATRVIAVDVAGDYEGLSRGLRAGGVANAGTMDILTTSVFMMTQMLTQANLQTHPADLVIAPKVGHLGPQAFNHAPEFVAFGRSAALRVL
ncbi:MAG: patatin-like phospholipase family protein, partial [Alphaproteobacteria bacterium]